MKDKRISYNGCLSENEKKYSTIILSSDFFFVLIILWEICGV